ncbi:hypothetical protein ACFO25_15625 [Paenactinomyces guangxiensis]|uniref:Uncharacterized protein n=1 Tax=Paenactinomyces guangxiensis TaxID=1490290 RepID=A0A7W1WTY6_9BACL|nr:hypothetical protein [Paenactinomyces guangxiensis]MBA4496011.1 hypothetical protein [Paenactinomyces guangxiensis]MBH8593113.1 hypothetical protein [Paenactinomyces guangxiensis]
MENQPIIEEKTSYGVLLYRKNRALRLLEYALFLLGFAFLLWQFEFRSVSMIAGIILLGIAVMLLAPAVYLAFAHPRYTLYKDKLVIQLGQKEESIPITEVEKDFDLRYFFLIKKKRTPLLVSDRFIDELNVRLEVIKRGWESK